MSLNKLLIKSFSNISPSNPPNSTKITVRIRPLNDREKDDSDYKTIKVISKKSLIISIPTEYSFDEKGSKKFHVVKEKQSKFDYDFVFDEKADQQLVYKHTSANLISQVLDGFNATIFAYGATGTGKTYTMLGEGGNTGIMIRVIKDLYMTANSYKNKKFGIKISYIEIYNEIIRDLLSEGNVIDIHEDPNNGIILQGVKEIEVENNDNFYDILSLGNRKRTTGSTNNNETSSRSHAVLRINLYSKERTFNNTVSGRFILVDLAGSEKTSINSSNNNAVRQNEGKNINKSLLALGVCINALAKKNQFIPWRNSKLTRILKDCLGGNSRIVMISTISPSIYNIDETINTLLYSNRAKNIQTIIKRNVISTIEHDSQVNKYDEIISNLSSELQGLRQELAVKIHNKHLFPYHK